MEWRIEEESSGYIDTKFHEVPCENSQFSSNDLTLEKYYKKLLMQDVHLTLLFPILKGPLGTLRPNIIDKSCHQPILKILILLYMNVDHSQCRAIQVTNFFKFVRQ